MSSVRNNKNIQSAVSSAVFVGLRAEHCHVSELFVTRLTSDDGLDIIESLKQLQEQNALLTEKLNSLCLKDLSDVKVDEVFTGDTLVYQNNYWQPAETTAEEEAEK